MRGEAQDLGVKIAIENHDGDMQAREAKIIIDESGKDYVGSNLDTGNPLWVVEDPFVTPETLAPYVVTTHVRDSVLIRASASRGGAVGGAGRRHGGFRAFHGPVSGTVPEIVDATGIDHGPAAAYYPSFGARLRESLPERLGSGIRALRGVGKGRASLHGRDGG